MMDGSLPPSEPPKPFHRRLTSLGPSADSPCADSALSTTDLGDSTRALTRSTPAAHCNDTSTPFNLLASQFSPRLTITLPPATSHLHDFVSTAYTATSSPDCNVFAADAFSQN